MARLRNRIVKAEFYTDGELLRWHRDKRETYRGLWALAEDSGCLRDDPFEWKMVLWPSPNDADITVELLQRWRDELVQAGKLIPYEIDGKKYLFIKKFHDHERPRNPQQPTLPLPPWVNITNKEGTSLDGKRWTRCLYEVCSDPVQTRIGDKNRSPVLACPDLPGPDLPCPAEKNSPAAVASSSTKPPDSIREGPEDPFDRVWELWPRKERKDYTRKQYARLSDREQGYVLVVAQEMSRRAPKGFEGAKMVPCLGPWLKERRWTEWAQGAPPTWQDLKHIGPLFRGYENPPLTEEQRARAQTLRDESWERRHDKAHAVWKRDHPEEAERLARGRAEGDAGRELSDELDALLGPPVHGTGHVARLDRSEVIQPACRVSVTGLLKGIKL